MKKFSAFCKKVGYGIHDGFLDAWDYIRDIPWNQPVKPVIAWSILGGALLIAAAVAVLVLF